MFSISEEKEIRISLGDTMKLGVQLAGVPLTADDRVIFTIKQSANPDSPVLVEKVYTPDHDRIVVQLLNEESEKIGIGRYRWDLRIVIEPIYNSKGKITDGRRVITPFEPAIFRITGVVGNV